MCENGLYKKGVERLERDVLHKNLTNQLLWRRQLILGNTTTTTEKSTHKRTDFLKSYSKLNLMLKPKLIGNRPHRPRGQMGKMMMRR